MTNDPMTVLVVGATGSIGRLVVDEALRQGHVVRALVRTTNKARQVNAQAQVIIGDVTRPDTLRDPHRQFLVISQLSAYPPIKCIATVCLRRYSVEAPEFGPTETWLVSHASPQAIFIDSNQILSGARARQSIIGRAA